MKLTTLLFGLLLAVGWTNVAQAQLLDESLTTKLTKNAMPAAKNDVSNTVNKQYLKTEFLYPETEETNLIPQNVKLNAPNQAPNRANNTITADVTHVKSWYENFTYNWVDGNGTTHPGVKITEPATDPYQMAYLLGTTYINPEIPGIQYSAATSGAVAYENVEFGWDLPGNARWSNSDSHSDIVIQPRMTSSNDDYSHGRISSIKVISGNTTITSWDYTTYGQSLPTGWTASGSWGYTGTYMYANNSSSTIIIDGDLLNGYSNVQVQITAYHYNYYNDYGYFDIIVNGTTSSNHYGNSASTQTWSLSQGATSITHPYENGYTVFLVKVKDGSTNEPRYTSSWNDVINYFDTHIDEVQLLTDGTRLNEGHDDAGTMFSYSGELNRFYFISKGKTYPLPGSYGTYQGNYYFDGAPTYCMFEEFSAHQPTSGADDITDFYSKLLYGNSYNVIHDCQGVNLLEHYFSMSGKTDTEHRSITNLIFRILEHHSVARKRT